jgi:hypothetical protein
LVDGRTCDAEQGAARDLLELFVAEKFHHLSCWFS